VLTGANLPPACGRWHRGYIFLDEVDAIRVADEEGDPGHVAEARHPTFSHRRKVFMVLPPRNSGHQPDRSGEYEASRTSAGLFRALARMAARLQWLQFETPALGHRTARQRRLSLRGL